MAPVVFVYIRYQFTFEYILAKRITQLHIWIFNKKKKQNATIEEMENNKIDT